MSGKVIKALTDSDTSGSITNEDLSIALDALRHFDGFDLFTDKDELPCKVCGKMNDCCNPKITKCWWCETSLSTLLLIK